MEDEDEDGILALYDLHWFRRFILFRSKTLPPPCDESPEFSEDSNRADSFASPPATSDQRSPVEESGLATGLQIQVPAQQTILSGNITTVDLEPVTSPAAEICESMEKRLMRWRQAKKRKEKEASRSLSELEFEELKGFIDLGFTFSDAEASDPWLISILPGLQRLRETDRDDSPPVFSPSSEAMEFQVAVTRPYLSEAWDVAEEEEMCRLLRNWRIPAEGEGAVLKDHLRFWAHAVASAVR